MQIEGASVDADVQSEFSFEPLDLCPVMPTMAEEPIPAEAVAMGMSVDLGNVVMNHFVDDDLLQQILRPINVSRNVDGATQQPVFFLSF